MKSLLLASYMIASAAIPSPSHLDSYSFNDYLSTFKKSYSDPDEYVLRRNIFAENIKKIKELNFENESWEANINQMADWTPEELERAIGVHNKLFPQFTAYKNAPLKTPVFPNASFSPDDLKHLPKSVDWRDKKIISEVKGQGRCGSCWAFSAAGTLEAYNALVSGELIDFSPQHLVDCVPNPNRCGGEGGCHGSTEALAIEYVVNQGGIHTLASYPYTSHTGIETRNCLEDKKSLVGDFKSLKRLPKNDYKAVMYHLAYIGPLSVAVDASLFHFYKSGVFNACPSGYENKIDSNHAVQLIGYGETDKGIKYWLIKNSWATTWGEEGYMKLQRTEPGSADFCLWDVTPQHGSACEGEDEPIIMCGDCGILYEPTYVEIGKSSPNKTKREDNNSQPKKDEKKDDKKDDKKDYTPVGPVQPEIIA